MICLLNVDENLKFVLSKSFNVTNFNGKKLQYDGILIDWVGKKFMNQWVKQTTLVEYYIKKKIPIVIYDRYFSISKKECDFLKKYNVFFFEPAINNRSEFSYLPQWTNIPKFKLISEKKRKIDLGFCCKDLNNKIKDFEKYYLQFSKIYPNKKVIYSADNINKHKVIEYKEFNLNKVKEISFKNISFTLLIDNQKNYNIGYLNENIFKYMDNNCLPLLPIEHKYFNNMFSNLIVKDISELNYYINSFEKVKDVLIHDIYDNVKKYYPEFIITNTVEKIKNCFK